MAVGKVTVDPNRRGAKAAAVAPDTDTRLGQKVTCDARRQTVSSILADLSKQTGVVLYAGYNNLDWQVRDRRMNVFSPGVSLKSLMDSISHVMKFKWSRSQVNGKWTYRLYMDRKTLLGIDRQRLLDEERLIQLEDRQRERVLDGLTRAAAMSDAELETLKTTDPLLYVEHKCGWSALMPDLFADIPAAKQAWTSGEMLTLNGADLSSRSQQALLTTMGIMGADLERTIGPGHAPPREAFTDLSTVNISINWKRKQYGYRGYTYIGDVTLFWPETGGNSTAFINPDSPAARETGNDYVRILDSGPVGGDRQNELNRGHLQAVERQKTDFGEPAIGHPRDPALEGKVRLKPMGDTLADLLRTVSKASGCAVVSDSFEGLYEAFSPLNTEIPLRDALDRMSAGNRYNWDKQGGVLEFRHRDWFRKRAAQVPDAWLEPWRKALKRTGTLTFDEFAQMSLLDDDQARENLYSDDVFAASGIPWTLSFDGDLLRGYWCLDEEQQAEALSDQGLDLSTVPVPQWGDLGIMFRSKPLLKAGPDAGIVLTCRYTTAQKQTKCTVVATPAEGSPATWEVTMPRYELSKVIAAQPWAGVSTRTLELFAEAKKIGLSDGDAWYHLGLLLYDGKRYTEALEAFEKACLSAQKQPSLSFGPLVWTGHILDLLGRRDEAVQAYTSAQKIDIGDRISTYDYDMVIDKKWVEERLKAPFERQ